MVAVGTLLRARGVTAAEAAAAAATASGSLHTLPAAWVEEADGTAAAAAAAPAAWVEAVASAEAEPRVVLLHRDAAQTRLAAEAATVRKAVRRATAPTHTRTQGRP
jgi:hypothetical protein